MANAIDSLTYGGVTGVFTTPYGTCGTGDGTAAKTVSVTNFSLEAGAKVTVKFTYANSASSPTLNVNSTGAKNIYWNGAALPSSQYWAAGSVLDFVYDGTRWNLLGAAKDNDTNTTYDAATTSSAGLMSASDKTKLNGIATGANKYSHPTYTAKDSGLYKVTVDSTGHVSAATSVAKSDITALGIPAQDTTYSEATQSKAGLMSASDKSKLASIDANAEVNQNAFGNIQIGSDVIAAGGKTSTLTLAGSNVTLTPDADFRKVTVGITKANVVSALGYTPPQSDTNTTYDVVSTTANGLAPKRDGSTSKFLRGDGTWAVPPDNNTTYDVATTSTAGLMSADDKSKLNGIASGANKYSHPTYTAKSSGLYKVTVDGTGHVSATASVAKSDITALGIPAQDTTYSTATTSAAGLMSAADKTKLDGITTGANKYTHPTSGVAAGRYNRVTVDTNGHVIDAQACTTLLDIGIADAYTKNEVHELFPLKIHTQDMDTINGLSAALGGKSDQGHRHVFGEIEGLQTALDEKSNTGHTHAKLTNSTGGGEVSLVYSSNTHYLRPTNTTTACGSTNYPWSHTYTNALTVNNNATIGGTLGVTGITTISARIQPNKDVNVNLGTSDLKWLNVYCSKSAMTTSDIKQKKNLELIDDRYIELFDLIQPYAYHFINGDRTHTGFIAQHVEEAMEKVGLSADDLGFFCKDIKHEILYDENGNYVGEEEVYDEDGNPVYVYSLRYEEYIAIVTEKVKRMEKRIDELEAKLEKMNDLEERLSNLENA